MEWVIILETVKQFLKHSYPGLQSFEISILQGNYKIKTKIAAFPMISHISMANIHFQIYLSGYVIKLKLLTFLWKLLWTTSNIMKPLSGSQIFCC